MAPFQPPATREVGAVCGFSSMKRSSNLIHHQDDPRDVMLRFFDNAFLYVFVGCYRDPPISIPVKRMKTIYLQV